MKTYTTSNPVSLICSVPVMNSNKTVLCDKTSRIDEFRVKGGEMCYLYTDEVLCIHPKNVLFIYLLSVFLGDVSAGRNS